MNALEGSALQILREYRKILTKDRAPLKLMQLVCIREQT
jgi:hypothetical protein